MRLKVTKSNGQPLTKLDWRDFFFRLALQATLIFLGAHLSGLAFTGSGFDKYLGIVLLLFGLEVLSIKKTSK